MDFIFICKNLHFHNGVGRNRLGQNVRIDRGVISGFHHKSDFDPCFAGQRPCLTENLDVHSLCSKNVFLFGGQICEAFICLEYRI